MNPHVMRAGENRFSLRPERRCKPASNTQIGLMAWPLLLSAVTLTAASLAGNPVIAIACIAAALTGLYAFKPPFWAVPDTLVGTDSHTPMINVPVCWVGASAAWGPKA